MQSLIVRRGLSKHAAGEDGPSFEQQFGILTNAIIADKFPQLDQMKLAFQLIEKSEDNSEACGVAVYLIGKNVIFVPSFFKNNKLKSGDMMFVAQSQQFLPLSDPWLAWLKNKDLNDAGDLIPQELIDSNMGTKGTTIRDIADPIIKTASVYLRGLLHLEPDMKKRASYEGLLDTTIKMGKKASETLLDNMIKNTDFLNAALSFYSGDELDAFAKKAYKMAEPEKEVELILPLDKEAKTLNSQELKALYKDGFFIRKTAASIAPDVIRSKQLSGMFTTVKDAGKTKLLKLNGDIKECFVLNKVDIECDGIMRCCDCSTPKGLSAARYMGVGNGDLVVVDGDTVLPLPPGVMCVNENNAKEENKDSTTDINSIGKKLTTDMKTIPEGSYLIFPNGTISRWYSYGVVSTEDNQGWTNHDIVVSVADNDDQIKPIASSASVILPKETRIIVPWDYNEDGTRKKFKTSEEESAAYTDKKEGDSAPTAFVTLNTLDAFLTEYCKKKYHKARIYNNGNEYVLSGDKSSDEGPKSIKEAALALVRDYDIDPAVAKVMLKEASNGATYDNPRSSLYYITKAAFEDPDWKDSTVGMSQVINKEPRVEQQQLPTILENPEQLQNAITTAAQSGIKEVFDITALKLIIKQNHFFDEIHDDLPIFMRVLDSLCRKLFQFYWHTDKMEEKYGMVKMKALEESLKCTLDSLSDLTIFFKLRTVDGTGVTGDSAGELMSGQML